MQEIIQLIRKKNQLLYDINCVRRYIESGDFDNNLKNAWDGFNKELEEVTKELERLKKPQMEEYEKRKLELLSDIRHHEKEISRLQLELKEIDKMVLSMNN